jgi:hypothetical protein
MTSTVTPTYAGFTFPFTFGILPRGPLTKRLAEFKVTHGHRSCGPYYRDEPKPNSKGMSFYLDSDFMPLLRWTWCDEVDGVGRSIDHTGWFTNDFCDDKIRGIVMRLPHGRGFLPGWSMGEHMASSLEYDVYDDEVECAYAADQLAEYAAEAQREYEEADREEGDDIADEDSAASSGEASQPER